MGTKWLAPGFYSTKGNSLGDEGQERWDDQDRLPDLATRKSETSKYGNCVALSGGGYRAALFHLGVLRRLNEVGMLGNIDTFACVSGGSIIGAILANTIRKYPGWWPVSGETIPLAEWEGRFAEPVRLAVGKDIRTKAILMGGLPIQGLDRAVKVLENQLAKRLDEARLQDLPQHPQFLFCASELERGDYWIFGRGHIGPYKGTFRMVMPHYPLARAVAASACFPPLFLPQRTDFVDWLDLVPDDAPSVEVDEGPDRIVYDANGYPLDLRSRLDRLEIAGAPRELQQYLRHVQLTDGGVYDNNAIEAVWADATFLLVSDAGGPFPVQLKRSWYWHLLRYSTIQANVGHVGQLRWLAALREGQRELSSIVVSTKLAGRDARPLDGDAPTHFPEEVRRQIAGVRTDMDVFNRDEIEIIEDFGYTEADVSLQWYKPNSIAPRLSEPLNIPWPTWLNFGEAKNALRDSDKRFPFRRALHKLFRRGPSYAGK
jgi:NTE family protein